MKLVKCPLNPILKPNPENAWESLCVLNPAVIYDEAKQEFVMFYRAAGNEEEHRIYLGLATSKDGVHFERKSDQPIIAPDPDGPDGGGIEDPRLIQLGDAYFMTYASRPFPPGQYWLPEHKDYVTYTQLGPVGYNRNDTQTHLAFSKDLLHWKKLGRITDHRDDDRDVIILPKKINGKYYRFSRPMYACGEGYPNEKPAIWVTSSDDMLEWKEPIKLFYQGKLWWEGAKVGGSTPMIELDKGCLGDQTSFVRKAVMGLFGGGSQRFRDMLKRDHKSLYKDVKEEVTALLAPPQKETGEMPERGKPIVREEPKVGRNDPCPCGSGKKYKKCCGKNL